MLTDRHVKLLEDRGLDAELLERLGFASDSKRGSDWVCIPYFDGGAQINAKHRTIAGEKRFYQDAGARQIFWNADVIADPTLAAMPLIVTEGELDAVAAIQAGFGRVVSVPNGAPQVQAGDDPSERYRFLDNAPKALADCREIILAVDNDGPGVNLLNDLALRLGRARCKWVRYPKGCKDLGDALREYGPRGVVESINRAQWMEVDGLYRMSELPPLPPSPPHASGFPGLDEHFRLRLGDLTVVTGIPSHGKALALNTPIPTPSGWTTMKDLSIGDTVFDERGNPTRIVAASPVMIGHPCFKLHFSDGNEIVADAEHGWLTTSGKARRSALMARRKRNGRVETKARGTDQQYKRTFPSVVTTAEIASSIRDQGKLNHHITNAAPLQLPEAALPIPPYLLGYWLGNGASAAPNIVMGTADAVGIESALTACGAQAERRPSLSRKSTVAGYVIRGDFWEKVRAMGLKDNKHIPAIYLRASAQQRLDLLRGLMDSDGHCAKDGVCEYTSVKRQLADGVLELVYSLGCRATFMTGRAMLRGKDCGEKYRIQFTPQFDAFTLQRKNDRLKPMGPGRGRALYRSIESCEETPSVPVKCVAVDSPSHLFLVGRGMIPTHNSTFVGDIACRMAVRHHWRAAFASFEQVPQRDHRRWLRGWRGHCREMLLTAEELAEADAWIDENFLFVVPSDNDDATLDWVIERLSTAVIRHGICLAVIDPWNEIEHDRPSDMTTTEYVGVALKRLKKFARRYRVHLFVVAHPMKLRRLESGKYPFPSLYDISDSAHWYNRCDAGIVVYRDDEDTTIVRVGKSRYHDEIGKPGDIKVRYLPDRISYELAGASA